MSAYTFLATNYEMPEVDNAKAKYITVQEAIDLSIKPQWVPWEKMDPDVQILYIENEEDLGELVISKETSYGDCGFTSYPFIYEINFRYSEFRTKQLLEYLKENIREGQIMELWRVWIGNEPDDLDVPYTRCMYKELSINHLLPLYNWKHEKFKEQNCLVIERQ